MDDLQYITQEPLRWDAIAYKAYGNEKLSELIIKANPRINIVDVIPSGTILNIPVIEEIVDAIEINLLPPWKQ